MNLSQGYDEQINLPQNHASELEIEPFLPRRGITSAHVQTIASYLLPRRKLSSSFERRIFDIDEGVQIAGLCHWQPERQSALTVVIVHGLEGSSESQYVLGTAAKAWDRGWNVVRMNVRNCGGTESLCRTLYHSGMSSDINTVVQQLIREEDLCGIALIGFSMGGNQVLKLAGEWGSGEYGGYPESVNAVAAVSPAMDLSLSADTLHLFSNRIYEWQFLWSLRRRIKRKLRLFPESLQVNKWWWKSIRDFDDCVTAPHCGFHDAEDYYTHASASRVLDKISIPTLILNSKDDPFIRVRPETRAKLEANPFINYYETRRGGHCAFLASPDGYDGRWAERQVIRFFNVHAHR